MKGLSVLVAIALFLLAHWLAAHLKRAGALPAENQPPPGLTDLSPATAPGDFMQAGGTPPL